MKTKILLFFVIFLASWLYGQSLSGPEIIEKVDNYLNPETCWAKSKMTIQTSSGKERTFVYESWSKNHDEKNLIRYLEPIRVKNQATLMHNYADDIWMYFPRTRRVRKLATHAKKQKMEGSDFSYEDMGAGDSFIKDYTCKRLEDQSLEDRQCYLVEMHRKSNADISYSRLKMYILKENFVPVRVEYYDEDHPDRLLKTLIQSDIRIFDGIPTAMKMIMINEIDNSETKMEFIEVKYNIEIDDALFTERGLKE
ncbi:outer membrane lipoprotein-sorting protein [bacterium]|nr:outer membrane lipoprotein-sorting protein [bacterium]